MIRSIPYVSVKINNEDPYYNFNNKLDFYMFVEFDEIMNSCLRVPSCEENLMQINNRISGFFAKYNMEDVWVGCNFENPFDHRELTIKPFNNAGKIFIGAYWMYSRLCEVNAYDSFAVEMPEYIDKKTIEGGIKFYDKEQ